MAPDMTPLTAALTNLKQTVGGGDDAPAVGGIEGDLETLKAAKQIMQEWDYSTDAIDTLIDVIDDGLLDHKADIRAEVGDAGAPAPDRLYLLCMWGDVDPQVCGPYRDERERTEAAQDSRRAHGEANGLYRVDANGSLRVSSFTGGELEMPAAAARSCERCGSDPAAVARCRTPRALCQSSPSTLMRERSRSATAVRLTTLDRRAVRLQGGAPTISTASPTDDPQCPQLHDGGLQEQPRVTCRQLLRRTAERGARMNGRC